MSLHRQIAHNTILQLGGKILSTFFGLIAIGLMTRYLGQERFGWYVTTISFLQLVGILIDFGMTPVTAAMLSSKLYPERELLGNLLGFRLVTAIVFLGLAPLLALLFPYPPEVKIAIAISTISFLAIAVNQVLIGFYQTKLAMQHQVIGELLGRIVLIGGLWLMIGRHSPFLPIMGVVTLGSATYTLYLWLRLRSFTALSLRFEPRLWRIIMHKSWPIAIAILFNVLYLRGDTLLLTLMRTQSEVGIYGAAYRVVDVVTQSAMMLMGLLLPLLASSWAAQNREKFLMHIQQSLTTMMALALPMSVGLAVLAHPLMQLLAGRAFGESGDILRILSPAIIGIYLGAVFGHAAVAMNRQKQTLWIYLSDAIFTITGYVIFIPRYGIYGGAWMSVFSELYAGILLFFAIRHYLREKLKAVPFLKIAFASLVMGLAVYSVRSVSLFFTVPLGVIIYGCLGLLLKIIKPATLKEIFSLSR